jgi:hypothetical protein
MTVSGSMVAQVRAKKAPRVDYPRGGCNRPGTDQRFAAPKRARASIYVRNVLVRVFMLPLEVVVLELVGD